MINLFRFRYYLNVTSIEQVAFLIALIRHNYEDHDVDDEIENSVSDDGRWKLCNKYGVLTDVTATFIENLYEIDVRDAVDQVFSELEAFYSVVDINVNDLIKEYSFTEVLRTYLGALCKNLIWDKPDVEVLTKYLDANICDWIGKLSKYLETSSANIESLAQLSYFNVCKESLGGSEDYESDISDATKLWKTAGSISITKGGMVGNREKVSLYREIRKFYQDSGADVDVLLNTRI